MINRSDVFITRYGQIRNIHLIRNIIRRLIVCSGPRKRVIQTIIIVRAQIKISNDNFIVR